MPFTRREFMTSVVGVTALPLAGCSMIDKLLTNQPDETRLYLMDVSESIKNPAHHITSFNKTLDCVKPEELKRGTRLMVTFITDNPISDAKYDLNEFLPAFSYWTGNERFDKVKFEKKKGEVKAKFRALFDAIPPAKNTPIIDSLDIAEKVFGRYKGTKKTIIIFSDMKEDSRYADFDLPARQMPEVPPAKTLVERIRKERELPDIKGAEVIVIGANATTTDLHRKIEKFWREFFSELGAKVTAYGFGLIDCL